MFVVIFRARVANPDQIYFETANRLRNLALEQFGCLEFISVTEGRDEVALSYWSHAEDILRWKEQADHVLAQKTGRDKWYQSYRVEVARIDRSYVLAGH